MARLVINADSDELSADDLFALVGDESLEVTQTTGSFIRLESDSGLFATVTGDFTAFPTLNRTIDGLSAGFNGETLIEISDFSITLGELQLNRNPFAAITAGDDTNIGNTDIGLLWEGFGGNDSFDLGAGNDTVFGGSGFDTLIVEDRFASARATLVTSGTINLTTQDGRDSLSSVELLQFEDRLAAISTGTSFNNTLTGNQFSATRNDLLVGGGGNDQLLGRSGSDALFGESGNDRLLGQRGADFLDGGSGNDTLNGGSLSDTLFGGSGADSLIGGGGRDRLNGGRNNDRLDGNSGDDILRGNHGQDRLNGGVGNDRLLGGTGRDTLFGGSGNDVLSGNGGADVFEFRSNDGNDTITDFRLGADHIRILNGGDDLSDLTISSQGNNSRVSFGTTTILVEDVSAEQLNDADHFLF